MPAPRRIVLSNFQAPGDLLMLSAAVRDLHKAYPGVYQTDLRTSCPALWEHNPHVTRFPEPWIDAEAAKCRDARPPRAYERDGILFIPASYPLVHRSNQHPLHFVGAFHDDLARVLKLPEPLYVSEFKGDVHLSADEKAWINQVAEMGVRDEYWLLAVDGKFDFTAKWPDPNAIQRVVHHFHRKIIFVQTGAAGNFNPMVRGAVNLTGQTDFRQLIRLMYHASGVLCTINGLMHLAAAVPTRPGWPERACVVLAGGREPTHWEAYPTHRYLSTQGALGCCAKDACWKSRATLVGDGDEKDDPRSACPNFVEVAPKTPSPGCKKSYDTIRVARCIAMISAEQICQAIQSYYDGGALSRTWVA